MIAPCSDIPAIPRFYDLNPFELASNAYRHARTSFTVSLRREDDHVVVEVADGDPAPVVVVPQAVVPQAVVPRSQGSAGRGLYIVAAVAKQWGMEARPAGKAVWAVLDY